MLVFLGMYILLLVGFPQLLAASKTWTDFGAFILHISCQTKREFSNNKHFLCIPQEGASENTAIEGVLHT